MSDWANVTDEGWERSRLVAGNAELADRLRRLGPALSSMACDLARARRENAALRRENLRLQVLLGGPAGDRKGAQAKLAAGRR